MWFKESGLLFLLFIFGCISKDVPFEKSRFDKIVHSNFVSLNKGVSIFVWERGKPVLVIQKSDKIRYVINYKKEYNNKEEVELVVSHVLFKGETSFTAEKMNDIKAMCFDLIKSLRMIDCEEFYSLDKYAIFKTNVKSPSYSTLAKKDTSFFNKRIEGLPFEKKSELIEEPLNIFICFSYNNLQFDIDTISNNYYLQKLNSDGWYYYSN